MQCFLSFRQKSFVFIRESLEDFSAALQMNLISQKAFVLGQEKCFENVLSFN